MTKKRFLILISGRGSNMRAIVEKTRHQAAVEIAAVVAHTPDSQGLQWAAQQGIPTAQILHRDYPDRQQFEQAIHEYAEQHPFDYLILAGFMRILSADFVHRYAGRIVNIHPSLLPAFVGLHTHQQALEAGVKVHGCTVHVVTAELDHGPILAQAVVPVLADDSAETLAQRVLTMEHQIYPAVVIGLANGQIQCHGTQVINPQGVWLSPAFSAVTKEV